MYYYEVWPASINYKQREPLTYSRAESLPPGQLLSVPLKNTRVPAILAKAVPRPAFPVKPIASLFAIPPLPTQLLQLAQWMAEFYHASIGETVAQLIPANLSKLHQPADKFTTAPAPPDLPPLTSEQTRALQRMNQADTYLLHGDTGSGKTRVYVELAKRALASGRSAVILTPEISLIPQLTLDFCQAFGDQRIVTSHSGMASAARRQIWLRALSGNQPLIAIGPRSALFLPLRAPLGLIVLDEAHDQAYKQEQAPRYHAAQAAAKLAGLHGAQLVLGSATPSVSDYYLAEQKQKPILRLTRPARPSSFSSPEVTVVDIRQRQKFSAYRYLSNPLLKSLGEALKHQRQSLLFLNRRGTARVVLCGSCGWQAACPACNLPLTYHGDSHTLRCHTCGRVSPALSACPACGSAEITLKSVGTKAIVSELQAAYPEARIARFDSDNPRSERLDRRYEALKRGDIDMVVGTQMVAKGLDLPGLAVVGVVIADTSLYFPDYTASERTFQLIRQVIGRVGRGHTPGTIIVQTYNPDSPVLQAALANDWDSFYRDELRERRRYGFPPHVFAAKLACKRASSASAQRAGEALREKIRASQLPVHLDGPSPAFHEKQSGRYVWQLVVKAKRRDTIHKVVGLLPAGWTFDLDPLNLL